MGKPYELFPKLLLTGNSLLSHPPRVGKKSVILASGVLETGHSTSFSHFRSGLRFLQEPPVTSHRCGRQGSAEPLSHLGKLWLGGGHAPFFSGRGRRSQIPQAPSWQLHLASCQGGGAEEEGPRVWKGPRGGSRRTAGKAGGNLTGVGVGAGMKSSVKRKGERDSCSRITA